MTPQPTWPRRVLQAAAIYNLLWGAWVILFPNHWFDLTGIPRPNYPGIWQCVGMIVGVYGLGYWWASRDFARHWPVIAVGFLGKIFGPIGFLQSVITGALPWSWGWMILTNDLIWWIPFGAMLYLGFKTNSDPVQKQSLTESQEWSLEQANELAKTSKGESIGQLSAHQDVLLVFLRHAGCTFCRETLDELSKARLQWQQRGLLPVVVHMGSVDQGIQMMKSYGLEDCPVISDPQCKLFRAYQLPRGTWNQLFGLRVWIEGFKAAILKGYGFGTLVGDGFQMSGSFVVRKGQVVKTYPSKDAADSCSWRPAISALIVLAFGITVAEFPTARAQSQEKSPGTKEIELKDEFVISEIKEGDRIEVRKTLTADQRVVEVFSQKGIGGFKISRTSETWPAKLSFRIHTKGLEQVELVFEAEEKICRTYTGQFNSTRMQESWSVTDRPISVGSTDPVRSRELDSKQPSISVLDPSVKPIESVKIPLEQGQSFLWTLPKEWLADQNPRCIEIRWIDFFRN